MGLSRDITERIEAEEALRKKTDDLEERVKELNCLYGMSNLVEKPDISLEDILQGTVDLIPPSWQYPEITCARAIVEGQELKTDNFKDTIWKQTNDIIVYGKSVGVLEVCCLEERLESDEGPFFKEERDLANAIAERLGKIIEHKRAEKALRASEIEKKSILDAMPDIVLFQDTNLSIRWGNETARRSVDKTQEELVGCFCYELWHGRSEPCEGCPVLIALETGSSAKSVMTTPDERWWEIAGEPVCEMDGKVVGAIEIARDITEKKKLEAQFQAAQRMEAMGTLAGGIAHNFNNILMGIQGNTSLVLLNKTSTHPDYERLKGIEEGVRSGAELTRQLLGFARGGKYEVKPTHLNELIENQNRMFGRTKKQITIRDKYEDNLWTVEVDQGQIEQVLLNLYVNAWQAMPAGGDLYIQTENVTLDEDYTKPYAFEPGRYVKISVTDTGVGMDEATQQRIFEPFFTTQEMGRGTGLGLASVYGIIRNHGGIINVYSEKGEGTTFNIYLPASRKQVIEEKKVVGEALKGTETVLLVDDEDMIIDVGVGILEELGYKVLIAKGGKEAVELYRKNKDKIDIVILDMIMPGVGGGATYDRLKKINPDIKVLLSSGYSINGQATEILERGCDSFIQKPFNMRDLSQKIREILDS